jgi:glycosyltransferase involved in cell wall biosynthesis
MKILWFTNTPCSACDLLAPNMQSGGWLKSLETELNDKVELSIAFYWGNVITPFKHKKTNYYPILRKGKGTRIGRFFNRLFHRTNNDTKEILLLLKIIEDVKPDVIHIHGTEDNFGLIQSYTNIPVVISIQGILSPYSEKFFAGISLFQAFWHEGIKTKLLFRSVWSVYNEMKKSGKRERFILRQAKYIIGRTDWDRRISRLLSPNSQYFVGNEILRPQFYEQHWNKTNFGNPTQLVTIMSSGLYKGLETIVKTAQILKENNSLNYVWTIVGQDKTSDLVTLVKKWLRIDYEKLNIKFEGNKNEFELSNILINSDIYCQVSHIENSPNSLCEAMLIGIPIIASFVGGTDSILAYKKEGILVQDGEPYSFAAAILEMECNYNESINFAQNARKKALVRHNKIFITNEMFKIYSSIIEEK